jgi:NTP pyrophosphatase (non-canonical NTP hydrolase)
MDNYIELALRTEPSKEQYEEILKRVGNPEIIRLLHAFMGLSTEVGEIVDALKKHIFYGKELDKINIAEELGDVDWYRALAIDSLSNLIGFEAEKLEELIKEINIAKLQERYPNKYSDEDAIVRDLDAERDILSNLEEKKKMIRYGMENK